jgi:hypothetical protein
MARQYIDDHLEDDDTPFIRDADDEAIEKMVERLAVEFDAAIVDRWIEWRDREGRPL